MQAGEEPSKGVMRAALAYSAMSKSDANTISARLSVRERVRLRTGLTYVTDATVEQRRVALRALVRATTRGAEWVKPAIHDDKDCPFTVLEKYPRILVSEVFQEIAAKRPLHVSVAMCHLDARVRKELWNLLDIPTRGEIMVSLQEVSDVSPNRTRAFAREIMANVEYAAEAAQRPRRARVP